MTSLCFLFETMNKRVRVNVYKFTFYLWCRFLDKTVYHLSQFAYSFKPNRKLARFFWFEMVDRDSETTPMKKQTFN